MARKDRNGDDVHMRGMLLEIHTIRVVWHRYHMQADNLAFPCDS